MSSPAIRVENLGKKYMLRHQKGEHYVALRDVLVKRARSVFNPLTRSSQSSRDREEFWALQDVSFEIQQGDRVGIIGRNGAGKSTLLKLLSRIARPTTGKIRLRGRVASLLEVGTGFHPELTGRENIFLNGAILGMSKAEIQRKFDEIVAFAEIEKFLDTPVKRYSSGMYVRLAFAVAAHLEPEILIVDEVLAVGDAQFQKKCLTKMDTVAEEGRTVLFVSHNIAVMQNLCNQAIWLRDGQIVLSGSIRTVADQYLGSTFQSTNPVIDLRTAERKYCAEDKLRLLAITFNQGREILYGETLMIQLEYEAYRPIQEVAFGIGFNSLAGTRLMTLDSEVSGRFWNFSQDTGTIQMQLENLPLQPGRYLIDLVARLESGRILDYLPGCWQIEVLPGLQTPNILLRDSGGVQLRSHWQHLAVARV